MSKASRNPEFADAPHRVPQDRPAPSARIARPTVSGGPVIPADVPHLQRSLGNAAVALLLARPSRGSAIQAKPAVRASELQGPVLQRGLTIANQAVGPERITQHSAYKTRLNSVISEEATNVGLAPYKVRGQLVGMAESHTDYDFPTMRSAVRAALIPLASFGAGMLSQETILKELEAWFGRDRARLHEASKTPAFAEGLLEQIRQKQSKTWIKATTIRQVPKARWKNQELQYWTARHYTSKCMVVLGQPAPDADGVFKVERVEPPPFTELLSSITLATMKRPAGATETTKYKAGDKVMMTFTSGAATSGHTTGVDWKNIGNVGDTFYGLFYKNDPATGRTPNFIRDAVYYAKWPASEFGNAWASTDWLGTAAGSQTEGGKTPEGEARQGELSDIIADIYPAAATREIGAGKETTRSDRESAFDAMGNFEVKKHGPMRVNAWLPIGENIETIMKWRVDTKRGVFIKMDNVAQTKIVIDTPGYALLKEARGLKLLGPQEDVDLDVYKFGDETFMGEAALADTLSGRGELFNQLKAAVDKKRAEDAANVKQAAAAGPPPSAPPPPPPPGFVGGTKPSVPVGGRKKPPAAVGSTGPQQ